MWLILGKIKVWTKKTASKNPFTSVSACIAFVQGLLRLVISHEMTINFRTFLDRNIYLRVLEKVFQDLQVAKISGNP